MITREQIVTEARTGLARRGCTQHRHGRGRGPRRPSSSAWRRRWRQADDFDVQGYGRQPDGNC